jgi:enamine deaminase RidA (YjgF/YER057c/UK114 family)
VIEKRAGDLGITISAEPEPKASYIPAKRAGNLIFTSGMGPVENGVRQHVGRVGEDVDVDEAYEAARIAVLNCLASVKREVGDLDEIKSIVKVTGYVRSAPGFAEQHKVLNGASDLLEQLFGERGKHTRAAIGVSELPFGISIEIEMTVEVEDRI